MPPTADVLGRALIVPGLPTHKQPKENAFSRVQRVLARLGISTANEETQFRWKIQDSLASILASVSPLVEGTAEQRKVYRSGQLVPIITVRHPYHLRAAFDLLPQIPDSLGSERRFMELILSRILRRYAEMLSASKGTPFAFAHEAKEYFVGGVKLERQVKKVEDPDERLTYLQMICDNYFHGRYYYYFALMRRERLEQDSRMHFWYARACFFTARIDYRGELMPKANVHTLPSRNAVMFLLRRDKSVMERYRADAEFRDQTRRLANSFPKG